MARVLKQNFPSARVGILIQRYTAEIVECNQDIDKIIFYDDGQQPIPFFHLVATLRNQRYDAVFHTHPRFRLALMTWMARIPVRVGTGYRWYSFLFNQKVYEHRKNARLHELEYNLNLLKSIGCEVDSAKTRPSIDVQLPALDRVKILAADSGIQAQDQLVIIHPGSGGSARDWSVRNFGLLGAKLARLPRVKVCIVGLNSERRAVDEVHQIAGKETIPFIDRINLKEYAALAKMSSLFIANSTGPLHIAAAVGTPVIGLYPQLLSLSAARWGPYTDKKTIFTPVNKPPDCSACAPGSCDCMNSISVEDVYRAALKYLVGD